jgi:hypothetical protein
MTGQRPLKPRPARAPASARPRTPASASPHAKGWGRERRTGAIACDLIAFACVLALSVYGVRSHMAETAARAAERDLQIALATGSALKKVSVLFVPDDGLVCRRRWIDNESWTLRDGGKVDCDDAATWNIDMPDREQQFERRLGAIRHGFQARNAAPGKAE